MADTPPEKKSVKPDAPVPAVEVEPMLPAPSGEQIEVETTGNFMILDPTTSEVVPHEGSAKVSKTAFIQGKIDDGQLKEV